MLGAGHGQRRSVAETDLHVCVFEEDNVAPPSEKVHVNGPGPTVGAHEDAIRVRAIGNPYDQTDELKSGCASCYRACISDIVPPAASDKGQGYGCTSGKIPRLGRS